MNKRIQITALPQLLYFRSELVRVHSCHNLFSFVVLYFCDRNSLP